VTVRLGVHMFQTNASHSDGTSGDDFSEVEPPFSEWVLRTAVLHQLAPGCTVTVGHRAISSCINQALQPLIITCIYKGFDRLGKATATRRT
jgi:hypothetical protein